MTLPTGAAVRRVPGNQFLTAGIFRAASRAIAGGEPLKWLDQAVTPTARIESSRCLQR
jgi:hypothetical protein